MIVTFQQFWKDFDRKEEELNSVVVSATENSDYFSSYVFFDGIKGESGVCRVYAKMVAPKEGTKKAIVVLNEIFSTVDDFDFSKLISAGYAVIIMDYAGKNDDAVRSTIYPKCFESANYHYNKNCLHELAENIKKSCQYIWTSLLLRTLTFAESEGYEQIGLLGVGEGGSAVIRALAIESGLKCGAIQYSHSRITENEETAFDSALIAYAAALGVKNYSPFIKAPLFMQLCTNEQNNSLDNMIKIFSFCPESGPSSLLALSERSDHFLCENQKNNVFLFFEKAFNGEKLLKSPRIVAKNSSNSLYFNISADQGDRIESVRLFVAQGQKISQYRNWREYPLDKTGAAEYLAKVPVFSASELVYAFATVEYENGFCISSAVLPVLPSTLKILPTPFTPKRLLYEAENGVGDWLVLGKEQLLPLSVEKGPLDIEGVCAANGKLSTFALSDKMNEPFEGALLQISMYSFSSQTIRFSLQTVDLCTYSHSVSLNPHDNWTKINLSSSFFKGNDGSLQSFNNVVKFEINSEDKFLVNTMLWV